MLPYKNARSPKRSFRHGGAGSLDSPLLPLAGLGFFEDPRFGLGILNPKP